MKLEFTNLQKISLENVHQLSEIQKKQLEYSAEMYFGDLPESWVIMFDSSQEGLVFCEWWKVVDESNPKKTLYDAWILNSDSADVFFAGTEESVGVGMNQYFFEAEEPNTKELADALQLAFDKIKKKS